MGTLKAQSNGLLYSNTEIGTVHWPLMDGLLYLVQRGRAWAGWGPAQSPITVPNVTAHPLTANYVYQLQIFDVAL